MARDLSQGAFDLFSGSKRTRLLPTLAVAALVTAAVFVPLILRAIDARDGPAPQEELVLEPADAATVMYDSASTEPQPLDAATVAGLVLISVQEPSASAVSFHLFAAGSDEPLVASQDLEGPQFDFIVSSSGGGTPLDSALLDNGQYELFVNIRTDGTDKRTAVQFSVYNP